MKTTDNVKPWKRLLVKAAWWVFPPLGTTLNGILGGSDATGLDGGYEQRSPDEIPLEKRRSTRDYLTKDR